MRYILIFGLLAFTFYGASTGKDQSQFVNREMKTDLEGASFAERFGAWEETEKGFQPAQPVAQGDDCKCDCELDEDD